MSGIGYTPILIYGSGTPGNTPSAGNLTSNSDGAELAINYADGKLFYKDGGGVVQVIATKGAGTIGGSNTQVQYNNNGALAGSANLTFNGTTLTAAGLAGPLNGTVGATTPNTGAFTTVNATTYLRATGSTTGVVDIYSSSANSGARNWTLQSNSQAFGDLILAVGTSQGASPTSIISTWTSTGLAVTGTLSANNNITFSNKGTLFATGQVGFSYRDTNTALYLQMPTGGMLITDSALNTKAEFYTAGASTGLAVTGALSASGALSLTGAVNNFIHDDSTIVFNSTGASGGTNRSCINGTSTDQLLIKIGSALSTVGTFSSTGLAVTGTVTATAPSNALGLVINGRSSDNLGALYFYANDGTTSYCQVTASSTEYRTASQSTAVQTWYTNGSERMRLDSSGNLGIGTGSPSYKLSVTRANSGVVASFGNAGASGKTAYIYADTGSIYYTADSGGNIGLAINATTGFLTASDGIRSNNNVSGFNWKFSTGSDMWYNNGNGAGTAASSTVSVFWIRADSVTSRSINAGGTINASGADYAEYETKADTCGVVEKGQIVGFDADGKVTDKWDNAISFGVKSTAPSYVGGDAWGSEEALGVTAPAKPADDATDEEKAQYESDKAAFEAVLEAARQKVDRVAYSGKVPVNVMGANVGDYIIAVQNGDGIDGQAVADPDFTQYKKAVGRVRRILEDGRAEVAVVIH